MNKYEIKALVFYYNKPSTSHVESITASSEAEARGKFIRSKSMRHFYHSTQFTSVILEDPEIVKFLKGFRK